MKWNLKPKIQSKKKPSIVDQYENLKGQLLRSEIAPKGGVIPHSSYLQVADGYVTYVSLTKFPYENLPLWQEFIKPLNGQLLLSLDSKLDKDIQKSVNNTYEELKDRLDHAKKETKIDALYKQIQELEPLIELINQDEVFVRFNATIKFKAPTLEELKESVEQFIAKLNKQGYDGTIYLDEQLDEMKQILVPSHLRQNHRKGHIIPISAMAGGYFQTVREHHDPIGTFVGFDEDGNPVLLNPHHKTKNRPNSNGFVVGNSGSGKSTFLFRMIKNYLMLGNRVRVIDPVGDFEKVVTDLGGITLALDGSNELALNPLAKVLAVDEDEDVIQQTLSKARTWLNLALPSLDEIQLSIFTQTLKSMYASGVEEVILSDVLSELKNRAGAKRDPDDILSLLNKMVLLIEGLIDKNGSLFNRHQKMNTFETNGICFAMRKLVSYDEAIVQAQFYNVLQYLWEELIVLGTPEKIKAEKGVPKTQLTETLLIIDEAHHFINLKNVDSISKIQLIQRENRKYEGALWFALQSILDFVKSSNDSASESMKQLFSFCEYNVIFAEKMNAIPIYHDLLGHRLLPTQINQISDLSQGEFFLNIGKETTLYVDSRGTYSKSDLRWMGGGA